MKPVCVALLGALLLLHLLSSQVVKAEDTVTTASPTPMATSANQTQTGNGINGCGRMDALTPLLLLALSASLLYGWLH